MKKNIQMFALSALLGASMSFAASQQAAVPTQQDQTAQADGQRANGHRPMDPQKQVKHLAKRLQLTDEQQSQLLPILSQRAEQVKALRSDTSLSATDRRAKMRDLRQESESQIRNILTDTQKQQYDAMLQQARTHMKHRGANTGSAS